MGLTCLFITTNLYRTAKLKTKLVLLGWKLRRENCACTLSSILITKMNTKLILLIADSESIDSIRNGIPKNTINFGKIARSQLVQL